MLETGGTVSPASDPVAVSADKVETAWQDAVNRVLNGQQEPGEAMKQAQEEAQAALDEAWAEWDE